MDFISHRVKRSDLELGDHIYTWRTPALCIYSHHGIYVGSGKVVHFTQEANMSSSSSHSSCSNFPDGCCSEHRSGVIMSCLDCFLRNESLCRFKYGVSSGALIAKLRGTCTTAQSDPPEAAVYKAMYLLDDGFGEYNVFTNNCEDFALYCKTGLLNRKAGGGSGQVTSAVCVPVAAVVSLPLFPFVSTPIGIGAAVATHAFSKYANDAGVGDDFVKVQVEDIAAFRRNIQ